MNWTPSTPQDAANILDIVPEAYVRLDSEFRYTFVNRAMERLLGKSRDELLGKMVWEVYPALVGTPFEENYRRAMAARTPLTFEDYYAPWQRWYAITATPDSDGGIVVHFADITEHKRAEEALRESEKQYRELFESSSDALFLIATDTGQIIDANNMASALYGYDRDELLTKQSTDVSAEPGETRRRIQETQTEPGQVFKIPLRLHRKKDGTVFPVDITARSLIRKGQAVLLVSSRDITERRRAEEALRESAERRRTILQTAMDGFWLVDTQGRLLEVNETYCRMSGYSAQELLAMRTPDLEANETVSDTAAHIQRTMAQGEDRFESRHRRKDGSFFDVEVSVQYRPTDGGRLVAFLRNITGRKRAEERLRESEDRYRTLFDQSGDGVLLLRLGDGVPVIVDASEAALKAHGYSREEMVGQPISLLEPGISQEAVEERSRLLAALKPMYMVHRRKDGSTFEVESVSRWVRIGTQDLVLAVERDITERKRAEAELRLSRQWLALHVQQTPLAVIEFDLEGRVRAWNPGAVKMFGFSREEAIGQLWTFVVPRSVWGALDGVWEALVTQRGGGRSTNENVTKDGRTLSCEWFNTPLIDLDGKAIGVASLAMDITDRKQAEQALRESEERFRVVATNTPDHILVQDKDLRYTWVVNPQLGLTVQDMVGWTDFDFLRAEDAERLTQIKRGVLESGRPVHVSLPLVSVQGNTAYFDGMYTPRRDSAGRIDGLIGYFRNVTEIKRAEEEQEKLRTQLAQAQKMESIGRLAGGVAHDFNNLLTVINGYSALALRRTQPLDPQFHSLTEILRAGERAAVLVRQLLAFSRKQVLQPEVIDLNATVGDMEKMLQRLVGEDIEIVVGLDPAVAPVLADRHQIEQVIMNLAVNARDAMPDGGTLTLKTGQRRLEGVCGWCQEQIRPGTYVELTVLDTGMGMDEHTLEHVFEPFFTTKGVGKGTGLGLSTVQGIVIQSGGHVGLESEPGQGSAFHIYLPVAERPTVEPGPLPPAGAEGGAETILLVEDQEDVRRFVAAILTHYGYRVVETGDAEQALRACASQPVDLLVTDVVMPKMSGVELARRARLTLPELRTLFISGYSEDTHERNWESLAGAKFLQKPFAPEALAAKVREVLEGR